MVKIAHSLGIAMIRIIMIHSPMAGAIMDRSEQGEILLQALPTEKKGTTSEDLKDQTC